MRSISGRTAVILCLVLVGLCPGESGGGSDKLIQELFVKSGLDQMTEQLPVIFQGGMEQAFAQDQNLKALPGYVLQEIKDAAARAYNAQKMQEIMRKSIAGQMGDAEIESVVHWLDSPLGIKCTNLEKKSLTAEGLEETARFAAEIQKRPPPAARLKLMGELDRATKATATSVEVFVNTNLAIATAVILSLPQETRKPLSEIKKELEANRTTIEKALQEQTRVSMLCTYRTLSDAEVRKYIDFANSPAGSKFNTVTIEAFQQAMVEGGIDFGRAAAQIFQDIGKKTEI